MKNKLLLSFLISLLIASGSFARIKNTTRTADFSLIKAHARQLIESVSASDTLVIPGGDSNAGLMEATINGDTNATGGGRINVNRVYKLQKNTIYTQYAGINIINPTGTLIMVGETGGTKPVIVLTGVNGVDPGMNLVQGSIKLDNLHFQNQFTNDNGFNNNCFVGSTNSAKLPQSVNVNNCLFEFIQLDTFSCDAYTGGAKFKFTNCYFRNLFNTNQWWGGRVWYCKQAIDTVWVENCTVTDGGLIFLGQNSLVKFAYYNHNTIINANKYWELCPYYLEGYWVNNLFINQNWVGEDYYNVATGGQDPDPGMLEGTMELDTITVQSGKPANHINIQAQYLLADGTIDPAQCGLDKIKALTSNNIQWTDTVLLAPYYKNIGNKYGTDAVNGITGCALSYLTWTSPASPPYRVVNIPGIWMNPRTAALYGVDATGNSKATHPYATILSKDNFVNVQVTTTTPAIKDATVADQMALWDAAAWGVTGLAANDIIHSAYIFGDYDPTTIPGYKTEDGNGIAKFTDLNENFAQTGTVKLSKIDGLPIGAQMWNDATEAAYVAGSQSARLAAVKASLLATGVQSLNTGIPASYSLSQNYPNPFNPTTNIKYSITKAAQVTLKIFDVLGREVETLVNAKQAANSYEVNFNASKLASGVYIYRLEAGDFVKSMKMMLIK
jgi:hypothetical protein